MSKNFKIFETASQQDNFQPTEVGAYVSINRENYNVKYNKVNTVFHNITFQTMNITSWAQGYPYTGLNVQFFNGDVDVEYSLPYGESTFTVQLPEGNYQYYISSSLNKVYIPDGREVGGFDLHSDLILNAVPYGWYSTLSLTLSHITDITLNGISQGVTSELLIKEGDVLCFYPDEGYVITNLVGVSYWTFEDGHIKVDNQTINWSEYLNFTVKATKPSSDDDFVFKGTSNIINGDIAFKAYSGTQFTKQTDSEGRWVITPSDIEENCPSAGSNGFLRQIFKTTGDNVKTIDAVHLSLDIPNADHLRGVFDNCKGHGTLDLSGYNFSDNYNTRELFK